MYIHSTLGLFFVEVEMVVGTHKVKSKLCPSILIHIAKQRAKAQREAAQLKLRREISDEISIRIRMNS